MNSGSFSSRPMPYSGWMCPPPERTMTLVSQRRYSSIVATSDRLFNARTTKNASRSQQ